MTDQRQRNITQRRICGDIYLQQLLYYNGFGDILWLLFWWAWVIYTYTKGLNIFYDPDTVRTVLIVVWIVAEPIRILSGWYGNLQESVPWLLMFVILSIVPQCAVCYFLLLGSQDRTAVTNSVQIVQAFSLALALFFGSIAVFKVYRTQKRQYYLFEYVWNQNRAKSSKLPANEPSGKA